MSRIYLSSPDVGHLEEEFLVAAVRSGWVAPLGPDVDALEVELAERIGVAHAVALSSGTAALHLGLLGLGVKPGDVVVTATLTFAATANAIIYVGARPLFVDCDPATGNIDPELVDKAIRVARGRGDNVAAIVPVDLLGKVADYARIEQVAVAHGIPVLSDAAESFGASREGRAAGSFGAAAALSFNGNKIMTTSGGGALLTDDGELAAHTRYLATQARMPAAHYEHVDIGYNYRLSNLLAAVGRAQLQRLDGMLERRRGVREFYRALFAGVPGVEIFGGSADDDDNCWLSAIVIDESAGWAPAQLSAALAADDIESRPLWKPMHAQPVFAGAESFLSGASDRLFARGLALPSGSVLTEKDLARVAAAVSDFLDRHS